jgi:hypothetical protein
VPEKEVDATFDTPGRVADRLQDPSTVVEFRGEIYGWMETLARDLRDATVPADVARIGVELLYLARGKEIILRDVNSEKRVDLWNRS